MYEYTHVYKHRSRYQNEGMNIEPQSVSTYMDVYTCVYVHVYVSVLAMNKYIGMSMCMLRVYVYVYV